MIIPIKLESDESYSQHSDNTPILNVPCEVTEERPLAREARFGDILIPALSKYFSLRDSKRRDFQSLLMKEHPLKIESFKKDEDKYELKLDVRKFKPEEISVKVTNDSVNILGTHEEKANKYNYERQEFLRRYSLPCEVNAEDIKCELSSDGHLLISAPKQQHKINISEVTVPITVHSTDAIKRI